MTAAVNDKQLQRDLEISYKLVSRSRCQGVGDWKREGDKAIVTFETRESALHFIHGYLDFWDAFKKVDTDQTRELRGKIREDYLPKRSMVDQVVILEPKDKLSLYKAVIPLDALDQKRLFEILTMEFPTKNPAARLAIS